jgi:hypothetical protein
MGRMFCTSASAFCLPITGQRTASPPVMLEKDRPGDLQVPEKLVVGTQRLNCDACSRTPMIGIFATMTQTIAVMALRKLAWATAKNSEPISSRARNQGHRPGKGA